MLVLCLHHDKSTPYRQEVNGIDENAVRGATEGPSAFLVQSGLSECGGEKRRNASVICETHKTNWQTESHCMKKMWSSI